MVRPLDRARRMRWLLIAVVLVGCNNERGTAVHGDAPRDAFYFNNCPWRGSGFGSSTCAMANSTGAQWCTCMSLGSSCTYENWENGCSCGCAATGSGLLYWQCTPDEPFSSPCPVAPPDAGGAGG